MTLNTLNATQSSSARPFSARENVSSEIIFWMCLVAFLMLIFYVKVTEVLKLHWIFVVYSVAVATLTVARYVFFMLYKPNLLPSGEYKPSINAIVPCLNESEKIYLTVRSIYRSKYPRKMISVTIVDDGSTDDTALWISKAQKDFGCNVITLKQNEGKRNAIQIALKESESEITVLIDSDVQVSRNGFTEIVRGFSSEKIAIVCGNTGVSNANRNLLTRMQEMYYYLSYRLFRSAESHFKTVVCCAGSFSAYRTNILKDVASQDWANHKFLGVRRTYGDDRSLTRLVLAKG